MKCEDLCSIHNYSRIFVVQGVLCKITAIYQTLHASAAKTIITIKSYIASNNNNFKKIACFSQARKNGILFPKEEEKDMTASLFYLKGMYTVTISL